MSNTSTIRARRPASGRPRTERRVGYLISVLLNLAGLFLINLWPGWRAVAFLTQDTPQVLGIVNAMLIVTAAVNVLYLITDPRWLVALGGLGTTVLGLIGLIQIWDVFPFGFANTAIDWPLVFRIALIIGFVGCGVAIVVQLAQFVGALAVRRRDTTPR
ncbi:hypothetical protein [Microlunatus sp. Gsoil 973]|jgi:hypothetical protein|uniref:hypothetical protein n=1 Tax=Microlunatus sp. Gsoil 973 TaxID=2672569 RepID=UPI0012B46826|nr:hypothetical protein [Microlunatus sp. Gsoil 973]QGN32239.1 hypothetical protein GJV80_04890 [Microlunatus sp. Gsoil 973]